MDDRRAQNVIKAFYDDRRFCVWAAAYVLSYANLARGGSPSEVIKTVQAEAWARNYQTQAGILNSLAATCAHHGVTWKDVGVGGNVRRPRTSTARAASESMRACPSAASARTS